MLYQNKYRVESARRPQWDYAGAGFYFVTICTRDRHHYFGEIVETPPVETRLIASLPSPIASPPQRATPDLRMALSDAGKIGERIWLEIPRRFPFARLDEFVVMPNHIHGIIQIVPHENGTIGSDAVGRGGVTGQHNPMNKGNSVSCIIRWYKGRVTFEIGKIETAMPFAWQTRFHDRVVRNESELNRIRQYIQNNPANWASDDQNAT
ncbi:MAG TPA: transposase [Abditibacteriaceae bacterium]|jgi:REP element-mobilizing transposase RayT